MEWNPEPIMSLQTFMVLLISILIAGSGVIEIISKMTEKEKENK